MIIYEEESNSEIICVLIISLLSLLGTLSPQTLLPANICVSFGQFLPQMVSGTTNCCVFQ